MILHPTAEYNRVVQWCSSIATPRVSNIELVILGHLSWVCREEEWEKEASSWKVKESNIIVEWNGVRGEGKKAGWRKKKRKKEEKMKIKKGKTELEKWRGYWR